MMYITYVNINSDGYLGIKKKIKAQMRALKSYYFEKMYYTFYAGQMMYLMSEDDKEMEKEVTISKADFNKVLIKWIEKYSITKTYIRYNLSSKWFLEFLDYQKKNGIKSVLEIPTFPYDKELTDKCDILEDRYYRKQLKKVLNIVCSYAEVKEIFGIPCIQLQNGIDIEEQPLALRKHEEGKIVMIAVASMLKWHAYERVILGMKQYYDNGGDVEIIFKLVGFGPEIGYYKELTIKNSLEDKIVFLGNLMGNDLNEQFDNADIAIGSLGYFRIGLESGSTIKLMEYCARGIPFIYGYEDTGFDGNEEYLLKVSNDEKTIDMNEIIHFYTKIKSKKEISLEMRRKVEKAFTWKQLLIPIAKYFNMQI